MTADLDAIRARLAAATPGPWHAWDRGIGYEVHRGRESDCLSEYGTGVECCTELNDGFRETFAKADADLIAHAPADLAALCDEVEALQAAVQRVRELHHAHACPDLDDGPTPSLTACAINHGGTCAQVGTCSGCSQRHPCPTLDALDGAE